MTTIQHMRAFHLASPADGAKDDKGYSTVVVKATGHHTGKPFALPGMPPVRLLSLMGSPTAMPCLCMVQKQHPTLPNMGLSECHAAHIAACMLLLCLEGTVLSSTIGPARKLCNGSSIRTQHVPAAQVEASGKSFQLGEETVQVKVEDGKIQRMKVLSPCMPCSDYHANNHTSPLKSASTC